MKWFKNAPREAAARVFVNGERIPIINKGVETHLRKGGPASVNRLSEVYFPTDWNGVNYGADLRALDPKNNEALEPVDVEMRDGATGKFHTVHRGFVRAFGGTADGNVGRRMVVGGVSELLDYIPASVQFSNEVSYRDVLTYVASLLQNSQPIFNSVGVSIVGVDGEEVFVDTVGQSIEELNDEKNSIIGEIKEVLNSSASAKTFTSNRHSLADVLRWFTKHSEGVTGFFPSKEGNGVVLQYDARGVNLHQTAKHQGGEVEVYKNNALYEISPINTLTVKGRTASVVDAISNWSEPLSSDNYPRATVHHPLLVKRAGTAFKPPFREIDSKTIDSAKKVAKNLLKSELDEAGGGEIRTALNSRVLPYAKFTSRPACGDASEKVSPLDYEVEEITHKVGYEEQQDSEQFVSETSMRVSMYIDIRDIVVVDSETGYVSK